MVNSLKSRIIILNRVSEIGILISIAGYIFSTALLQTGVYISIISWMLYRICNKENPIPKTPVDATIILLVASLMISVFTNQFYSVGIQGLHKWLRGILLFGVSYHLFQSRKFENRVSVTLLISLSIACFDGIWQYFSGYDFLRKYPIGYADTVKRITSSFGYFGMFASYLLMATPICLTRITQMKNKWWRIVLSVAIASMSATCLFLTRTRGAWLTALTVLTIYLLSLKKIKLTIAVLGSAVVLAFFLPKDLIFHSPESHGIDKTTNHRLQLWSEAINIIKAKPVFGCGLNAYVKCIDLYNTPQEGEVRNYYAHNGYLQHAAETGVVGFLIYSLLIAQSLRSIAKSNKKMILLSLLNFLFYMFFDTIFHNMQPFIFFWILLGWALAPQTDSHT